MSGYRVPGGGGNSHGRMFASYPVPAKIDLLNERPRRESLVEQQLENKIGNLTSQHQEIQRDPSPRPNSRCASVVSDLLEKEAKLMQEIEEIERKPYNPQTMVVVLKPPSSTSPTPSSTGQPGTIHTTIIRSPRGRDEIDNRSPLPIAFDNLSTKGVRGNIASIGAIEPDRPRPPIYPIMKRSPSPQM